jgi:hypothetical protein
MKERKGGLSPFQTKLSINIKGGHLKMKDWEAGKWSNKGE